MTASPGTIAQIEELLAPLGGVRVKRMFSGAGLFCDGLMLGLVIDDVLYLKADEGSRAAFEAEGMGPFVYERQGRQVSIGYWRAPERLLDEADEMLEWARAAMAVARRKAATKARSGKMKPGSRKRTRVSHAKAKR